MRRRREGLPPASRRAYCCRWAAPAKTRPLGTGRENGMHAASCCDVTSVITQARISGYQWMVLAISLTTALFDGYDTQGIAYVAPVMAKDLGIPPQALGPVFSAGLLGLTFG